MERVTWSFYILYCMPCNVNLFSKKVWHVYFSVTCIQDKGVPSYTYDHLQVNHNVFWIRKQGPAPMGTDKRLPFI